MNTLFLNEFRCECGKLLLKGIFFDGTAEIKCRNCGRINKIGHIKMEDDENHYLLIINNKGNVTNASISACNILGYAINELIGKHFTKINPTMSEEFGERMFGSKSVLNEDNYFQLDTSHVSKNGKNISISAHLKLYIPNDKEKYVLLSAKLKKDDIKKRPNKDVSKFSDSACDFYFEIDQNGMGTYISPSFEKLFGLSCQDTIGKSYFDVVPVECRVDAIKTFLHFSAKEEPFRRSNNTGLYVKDKNVFYDIYFTPNFNDMGKFVGYRVLGWLERK